MKKLIPLQDRLVIALQLLALISLLFTAGAMLQGCEDKCETVTSYITMEPVYMTTEEVRNGFGIEDPHPIETSGKIYVYGDYLLVNEPSKGIHIIENKDCNQKPIHFIAIPGNYDMAVKDFILYADSYVDLLAIDISNLPEITLEKRVENAFPYFNQGWNLGYIPTEDEVIITRWEEKEVVEKVTGCQDVGAIFLEGGVLFMTADASSASKSSYTSPTVGIAGSMARFAITGENLYAVDNSSLRVFDITTQTDPVQGNVVDIGWGIETIFPYKDNLFIGSNTGMYIYDNSNPSLPTLRSQFNHVRTCDPVVVDDKYAYVTLRSGNECDGFTNQLDVLDITNLNAPFLVKSYPMQNPHGLSIDGDLLFITEGDFGMKVFDATNRDEIGSHLLDNVTNIHGFDVIAFNEQAILIGEDGLYLYNYTDPTNLEICGFIAVGQK